MKDKAEKATNDITEKAIEVMGAFDQANTDGAIKKLGSRGIILNNAVDDLRKLLNKNEQAILTPDVEEMIEVVNAFDQANTNSAIEGGLGSRGEILKDAINELRELLNKGKKRTILTSKQAKPK